MSETLTRRSWLTAAGGLAALSLGLWPRDAAARVRPPGALPEDAFARACIRCFRCAEVCPPKAIRFDGGDDLPWLDLSDRACVLCMQCTEVCPTAALDGEVKMGTPVVDRERCLPWTGDGVCRLCWYACPYADEAIVLTGPRLAPVVRPDACPGCGLCEEACPTDVRAIRVVPAAELAT